MAKYKSCPCGKSITARRDLCAECLGTYGVDKKLWPDWLKFAIKDHRREWNYDRNHDDLEIWEKVDYSDNEEDTGVGHYEDDEEVTEDESTALPTEDEGSDSQVDLVAAMSKLEEHHSTALVLFSQGYKHQDIADQMGVSLRTAKQYTQDARELIQKWMK